MISTQNLSLKEKVVLVELCRAAEIAPLCLDSETLNSLKPGVLEAAHNIVAARLKPRKLNYLQKIIQKIVTPKLMDGEILIPEDHRLAPSCQS